ncbi:MAG: NAD(P)H-dependent oxidoreductase [Anaeroplasmataceae bacterium]|nr:NAD(P)H-dependent oxidoreductase [Anaeroplasmataceae bacterium]MDE6415298.1 NAD(P)H-dependent oxidoreductase [Anaeroplasmataceae bacterium]
MKSLIVYYSRKGENYWNGTIKNLEKGNTEIIAEMISKLTAGDLFEIETVKSYSNDYYKCINEAQTELHASERPALKSFVDSIKEYDTIFVGYPNWWGTMPMAVFTFLEHYDLSGKTILPFCTNEGSGMGSSEKDLKRICKGAVVKLGLSIHGAEAKESEAKVKAWLDKSL